MNGRRLASVVLVLVCMIAVTSAAVESTAQTPATIAEIQGASHISPLDGESVNGVEGVVTARRTAGGRGVWIQDPTPDADVATSDGVFVFINAAPVAKIGDLVGVIGTVSEFRAANDPDNLTITQITSSNANVTVLSSGNPLPAPTVLGIGGRVPPTENIDDDAAGNVETGGTFDAVNDAIDFYESLEGMRLQVNDGAVVGATRSFGEITLLPDEVRGRPGSAPREAGSCSADTRTRTPSGSRSMTRSCVTSHPHRVRPRRCQT